MIVPVFPLESDSWTFREEPGTIPIHVKVPRGSALLPIKSIGMMLFVVSPKDPRIRAAWSADQIMREAFREGSRFAIVRNRTSRATV